MLVYCGVAVSTKQLYSVYTNTDTQIHNTPVQYSIYTMYNNTTIVFYFIGGAKYALKDPSKTADQ